MARSSGLLETRTIKLNQRTHFSNAQQGSTSQRDPTRTPALVGTRKIECAAQNNVSRVAFTWPAFLRTKKLEPLGGAGKRCTSRTHIEEDADGHVPHGDQMPGLPPSQSLAKSTWPNSATGNRQPQFGCRREPNGVDALFKVGVGSQCIFSSDEKNTNPNIPEGHLHLFLPPSRFGGDVSRTAARTLDCLTCSANRSTSSPRFPSTSPVMLGGSTCVPRSHGRMAVRSLANSASNWVSTLRKEG